MEVQHGEAVNTNVHEHGVLETVAVTTGLGSGLMGFEREPKAIHA